jgi:hypothetical protein
MDGDGTLSLPEEALRPLGLEGGGLIHITLHGRALILSPWPRTHAGPSARAAPRRPASRGAPWRPET